MITAPYETESMRLYVVRQVRPLFERSLSGDSGFTTCSKSTSRAVLMGGKGREMCLSYAPRFFTISQVFKTDSKLQSEKHLD